MTNLSPNIASSKLARWPRRVPFECRPVCSEGSITRSIRCLYFSQLQHVWIANCVKLKNIYIGRLEHDALTWCNHGSMSRFWSYLYFRFAAPYTTYYINTLFLVTKNKCPPESFPFILYRHITLHSIVCGSRFLSAPLFGTAPRGKTAVLLDFVQMRGGGPCPNFLALFIIAFLVN